MTARVLVVDDLRPNVKLLEAKLSAEYFDVITASDGPSALESVKENSPDIILLDVMMPGMDGFEVCRCIKSNPHTMHIPVVMVTALSDSADRVRGLEAGADDFLTKPVNDTAMFARVHSLVRLKKLTDEWLLREKTSKKLGVLCGEVTLSSLDFGAANILIIEDNQVDCAKIAKALEEDDAKVTITPNLVEADELLTNKKFDLVVINLHLRDQDALRFCSRMKVNDMTRLTPILIVTEEDPVRLAKGLELGVSDYLIKPIERNELKARFRTQIRRQRYQDCLRDNYQRSMEMALIDSLTGLHNHRYIETHVSQMIKRQAETDQDLALLAFDVDLFKSINDTYGHPAGDEVLRSLAERIYKGVRNVDIVARVGGEEFVLVMPDTDEEVAHIVAERLRNNIASQPFTFPEEQGGVKVTVSIGVAMLRSGETQKSLFKRADVALYEAKRQGRDRVVADTDEGLETISTGD